MAAVGLFAVLYGGYMLVAPAHAHAASQTIQLNTTIANDDPFITAGDIRVTDTGVELKEPFNTTNTQSDSLDSNNTSGPWGYTWHITMPTLCSGAQIQSMRLITDTQTQNETPLSGVFLALYGGSDNLVFRSNYTINNGKGEDLDTWFPAPFATPAIDRGIGDNGEFPAALGLAGQLDATWDLSAYTAGDTLGIYLQHWFNGSTTIAQTTIQSVQLTYDDANCSPQLLTGITSNNKPFTLVLPNDVTAPTVSAVDPDTIPKDGENQFPADLTSFQFTTTPGATKTVTLYYDLPGNPSSYTARKYKTNTQSYLDVPNATITREDYNGKSMLKLSYNITDGGILDQDGLANGTVIDPVGLATTSLADTGDNLYVYLASLMALLGAGAWVSTRQKSYTRNHKQKS